jgi:TonB-linked SusC/RagA family outer membrane protein
MRNTVLILLISGFQVFATGSYAQTKKISLAMNDATIREVLYAIQKQSEFYFLYNSELIDVAKKVDITIEEEKVDAILTRLFNKNEVDFLIKDRYIVLTPVGGNAELFAEQQQPAVSGTVTDESGQPLPGVTVIVKGTTQGTVTNADGEYSITNIPEDATLVFSFVGMLTQEFTVGNLVEINVTMAPDAIGIEEVVAIGYGTMKKRDITGAITSVAKDDLLKTPAMSASQALQGKAAGLDVVASGNRQLGENPTLRIRGNRSINAGNSPLIVVDGIPYSGNFNDINPNDIESVEILKDASSTAIYGSRGANGVILVTTTRGAEGKSEISYNGYYGVTQPTGKYDWMNAEQYLRKFQLAEWNNRNRLGDIPTAEEVLDPVEYANYLKGVDTDWQDLVVGNGSKQNHQISVNGGNDKTQYLLSLNYYNETGLLKNTSFDRLALRLNLDQKINNWLKIGTSTFISVTKNNKSSDEVPFRVFLISPLGVPYDENGELIYDPVNDGLATNPLMDLQPENYQNETRGIAVFPNVYSEIIITEGLKYRMNIGAEAYYNRRGLFQASNSLERGQGTPYSGAVNGNTVGYTFENILNYNKTFGKHLFDLTGVYSTQLQRTEGFHLYSSNQPYESSLFYNLGGAPVVENYGSSLVEWSIMSYMGRLNYSYDSKYLATFAMRADGSSRLADGNKWSYFPSGALAWRISQEPFLVNSEKISDLKLRASYGITGNTAIAPYQTQGGLTSTNYAFGETPAFGYRPGLIANPTLGWEKSATLNFGLDFSLLSGKINGSVEWYNTNTTDLLLERQLPSTSGFSNILQNIGETKNTGWEFTLNTDNLRKGSDFSWNTQLNLFANKEKIVSLYQNDEDDLGNRWFIGHPVQVFFDYKQEGIYQLGEEEAAASAGSKTGGIKVKDVNGDGSITPDDRVILGTPLPDLSGGLTNSFEYKNFSLSFQFYARLGQEINGVETQLFARFNTFNLDYWTPENPVNRWPMPGVYTPITPSVTMFDGSFVKVRNINLGYNIPKEFLQNINLSSCRIYFTAENPFIFTKYKFADPEISDGRISPFTLPSTKSFIFGIDVRL